MAAYVIVRNGKPKPALLDRTIAVDPASPSRTSLETCRRRDLAGTSEQVTGDSPSTVPNRHSRETHVLSSHAMIFCIRWRPVAP